VAQLDERFCRLETSDVFRQTHLGCKIEEAWLFLHGLNGHDDLRFTGAILPSDMIQQEFPGGIGQLGNSGVGQVDSLRLIVMEDSVPLSFLVYGRPLRCIGAGPKGRLRTCRPAEGQKREMCSPTGRCGGTEVVVDFGQAKDSSS
jgi:hypothetical protein